MSRLARALGAMGAVVAGAASSGALVAALHRAAPPRAEPRPSATAIDVATLRPPPPPPRAPVARARPAPSRAPELRAPPPNLGGALAGLAVAPGASADPSRALAGLAKAPPASGVVMTEASVDQPPSPAHTPPPDYPGGARQKGLTGHVVVRILIDRQGAVAGASVVEASPPGVFEAAVLDAVRSWRFSPARFEGAPVPIQVTRRLVFKLG